MSKIIKEKSASEKTNACSLIGSLYLDQHPTGHDAIENFRWTAVSDAFLLTSVKHFPIKYYSVNSSICGKIIINHYKHNQNQGTHNTDCFLAVKRSRVLVVI